jgi:6-pyruvoyltetrahydropterin/6-carboxytetrahydropterin synthase
MESVRLTKSFSFEMAHLLPSHTGLCRNIHGHSYKLSVTVRGNVKKSSGKPDDSMVMDFAFLKKLVKAEVVEHFDHALVVPVTEIELIAESVKKDYKLVVFQHPPTCERLILWIVQQLTVKFPVGIDLVSVKLQETKDSYAEWHLSDNLPSPSITEKLEFFNSEHAF